MEVEVNVGGGRLDAAGAGWANLGGDAMGGGGGGRRDRAGGREVSEYKGCRGGLLRA